MYSYLPWSAVPLRFFLFIGNPSHNVPTKPLPLQKKEKFKFGLQSVEFFSIDGIASRRYNFQISKSFLNQSIPCKVYKT